MNCPKCDEPMVDIVDDDDYYDYNIEEYECSGCDITVRIEPK